MIRQGAKLAVSWRHEPGQEIIHSENTLKEISYDLGFSDRPYFSRFFKKQTGKTPEEFQKEARLNRELKFNTLVA